ncbi:penicillin-binding transpeptidase domain-containing protein [Fusobacterium sp. PH5-44]|uniref:penicillin-binding transpeptidase domain-containing protein n=1 Tax=unclassified Fusobacterium TaxID=2648384 RepID=UPI003D1CEEBD
MKFLNILLVIIFYISNLSAEIVKESDELNKIFGKYKFESSILIYDQNNNSFIAHNLKRCNEGFTPASTFKIPNTLISLETGVTTTEHVFNWDKKKKPFSMWEKDMNIEEAFKVSNVPVYQEIAQNIGVERMLYYTKLLNYGDLNIDSKNITTFWLEENSKITSFQQIYFLENLYNLIFPFSKNAMEMTKKIMISETTDKYTISSKSGTTKGGNAWYVGYVETKDNVYYFATNISNKERNIDLMAVRKELTKEALKAIGAID